MDSVRCGFLNFPHLFLNVNMSKELNKTHCPKSKIDLAVFYVKWAMDEKIRHDYRMLGSFKEGGIMQNSESQEAILHKDEQIINSSFSVSALINNKTGESKITHHEPTDTML